MYQRAGALKIKRPLENGGGRTGADSKNKREKSEGDLAADDCEARTEYQYPIIRLPGACVARASDRLAVSTFFYAWKWFFFL